MMLLQAQMGLATHAVFKMHRVSLEIAEYYILPVIQIKLPNAAP